MSNYDVFLKSCLNHYKNPDLAKRDILGVFTTFNDLRPKLEDFVFNDGTRKSLLQLEGTIPANYRGSIYNIPVCIWLMDTHPYNRPMVYVRPTSTMLIKGGRNVDMNGKVNLPYLREWKYPNSDLLGMIQILTIVFGEEPPVYSIPQTFDTPNCYPRQGPYPYPTGYPTDSTYKSPYPTKSSQGNLNPKYPGISSYNSPYPMGISQGKSYPEYPGVGSDKPSYPPRSSNDQDYTGYSTEGASRQHALRIQARSNNNDSNMTVTTGPATSKSETDVGDTSRESDLVSGKKSKQKTENDDYHGNDDYHENDDYQASAEDFDMHCEPCFTENNFVEAERYCLVCKEYFCKACLRYHRKISATKTHKILEKENMPKQ